MKIAYTSDLHLDFYNSNISSPDKTEKVIDKYILKGETPDILIIAGDISHYNIQTLKLCKYLNSKGIKIILTVGNHEFYNVSKKQNYRYINLYDKVNELKELLEPLEDTYFLDGNTVILNGIKFGGAMGWYDGSYYYKLSQGMYQETMMSHWCNYTNDARLIPRLNDPMTLFNIEIKKIKSVLNEHPDIMISHVCPISEGITFNEKYKTDRGSGYYCFDGLHLIDPINNSKPPKFWIHGHIHDKKEFKIYKTTHLRNPLGYPKEKHDFKLQYIDTKELNI